MHIPLQYSGYSTKIGQEVSNYVKTDFQHNYCSLERNYSDMCLQIYEYKKTRQNDFMPTSTSD